MKYTRGHVRQIRGIQLSYKLININGPDLSVLDVLSDIGGGDIKGDEDGLMVRYAWNGGNHITY